eukprot:s350_g21.t1
MNRAPAAMGILKLGEVDTECIYLFNGTCFAEATYSLVTTSVEAYLGGARTMEFNERVYRSRSRVHYFFLGMGAVASSAAIGNVVTVEMTFEEWLESFRPSAKFWSTKILLSIGFIQTLLLEIPPLSTHLSITEKDLFYASLLCIECFLLSLLHVIAWNPSECAEMHKIEMTTAVESPAKSGGKPATWPTSAARSRDNHETRHQRRHPQPLQPRRQLPRRGPPAHREPREPRERRVLRQRMLQRMPRQPSLEVPEALRPEHELVTCDCGSMGCSKRKLKSMCKSANAMIASCGGAR